MVGDTDLNELLSFISPSDASLFWLTRIITEENIFVNNKNLTHLLSNFCKMHT